MRENHLSFPLLVYRTMRFYGVKNNLLCDIQNVSAVDKTVNINVGTDKKRNERERSEQSECATNFDFTCCACLVECKRSSMSFKLNL